MLKKTISFEGVDGKNYTEDFYFNLTRAEIIMLESSIEGTLSEKLKFLAKNPAKNGGRIMAIFEEVILKSVGNKSEDGKRFEKSPEISNDFKNSMAYDKLFMELVTDAEKGAAFVNGIMPKLTSEEKARAEKVKKEFPQPTQRKINPEKRD